MCKLSSIYTSIKLNSFLLLKKISEYQDNQIKKQGGKSQFVYKGYSPSISQYWEMSKYFLSNVEILTSNVIKESGERCKHQVCPGLIAAIYIKYIILIMKKI